jgi:hypothetical protein
MNKHYKLLKSNDNEYTYVSVSTDFARPDDYMEKLEVELHGLNYRGKIAFDLLLSNGIKDNRYFCAYFDGQQIISSTFSQLGKITSAISGLTSTFYKENYNLVSQNHILSKPQKFLIKKGITKVSHI